jgi:ribosomal protein S18 acetylase RimI-like enzyme
MTEPNVRIRPAERADLPTLGQLGALLMRAHHAFDARRFVEPGANPEDGYASFLGTQLGAPDVVVLVAERDGDVIGYVYAGIEPHSWKELREKAGFIHDIVVDERGRRMGVASALVEGAIAWLRGQHMPRVLLWTSPQNDSAQELFARLGFRRTMIEMTREIDP